MSHAPRVAVAVCAVAAACGPSATPDLSYDDIDADYLVDTLLVVASSRQDTTPFGMEGSTILVDRQGTGARLDNDGMDTVSLASDGDVVAFSDLNHDFLLGSPDPVREREEVPDSNYARYLVDGSLVSLFNGGFGPSGYELVVSETAGPPSVRRDAGFVYASAQCASGVWAALNPDFATVGVTSTIRFQQVTADEPRSHEVTVDDSIEVRGSACAGSRLVSLGVTTDASERETPVAVTLDVDDGTSSVVPVADDADAGISQPVAIAVIDDDLVTVSVDGDASPATHRLQRLDPSTGRAETLATIESSPAAVDTLFRFDAGVLYVLDVTRDEASSVTAYAADDGEMLATREIDALDDQLNGATASFDRRQFVRDFVVLTPFDQW